MNKEEILIINPGSTSTKLGIFKDDEIIWEKAIDHDVDFLFSMGAVANQLNFRVGVILKTLEEENISLNRFKAVVGRGGMLIGLKGGAYIVDERLANDLNSLKNQQHASNLGGALALNIAKPLGIPAMIYDSTMGCELTEVAKVSGLAQIDRYGCFHVLNMRAQSIKYANSIGKKYEDLNLIVCHMGGGITLSVHEKGKIIDGLSYDDGPMSPDRTGGIPLILWYNMCDRNHYTREEQEELVCGKGGLYSYFGVKDCRKIEDMILEGNKRAKTVYEAMAYQIAKAIGSLSICLKGKVDAIILTGGIAYSKMLTAMIQEYAGFLGEIVVIPGENELLALGKGCNRVLLGEEKPNIY